MASPRTNSERQPLHIHPVGDDKYPPGDAFAGGRSRPRRSRLQQRAAARLERDRVRGYSINVKQVVLAFAVEFWIIGLIVIGTYLLIAESAHDYISLFSALLLPAALAMVELARVPLAIAVRTQEALHINFFAALGVVAAITVTTFSLSQIAWRTFDIRIAEATRANDKLSEAKATKDSLQNRIVQSSHDMDQKVSVRNSVNDRLAGLEAQLTKISSATGKVCKPMLGQNGRPAVGGDGRIIENCTLTATVNQAQLNTLKAQITSTKKELEIAEAAIKQQAAEDLKKNDPRQIEEELVRAEAEYRAAVNKSQLHSYTSMVTGKAVAEVTEAEVKNLEKYLIIIPSIAAAFASTLIAITAVRRIRAADPQAAIPDEAAAYLFGPLVAAIRAEAKEAVASAVGKAKTTEPPNFSEAKVA
jgi:hypothetical protein